jgi:hypothetical protein
VLHGSSGVLHEEIARAVGAGLRKIEASRLLRTISGAAPDPPAREALC